MDMLLKLEPVTRAAAQRCSQSLAKMAHTPVEVHIQRSELVKLSALSSALSSQELVILSCRVIQDIQGVAAMLFSQEASRTLADLVLNRAKEQTQYILDAERSALEELANVTVGNFLTAFAQGAGFKEILHNAPVFSVGSVATVVNQLISPLLARKEELLLLSEILFEFQGSSVKGNLLLLCEVPGLEAALARLS